MSALYKDVLKETFESPESFNKEKLEGFVQETLAYFREMQEKLSSKDPEIRQAALNSALEVKLMLEQKMETVCKAAGIDPTQLASLLENKEPMGEKEKEAFESLRDQLDQLKPAAATDHVFKRRVPKLNLVG